jgi:succinoglycan biosynthesis transport protein ExoP
MNLDQGIQVIDLFGLAHRRGKLMAIVAGAAILVTFWVAMALPNLYESSAMILVEPQSVDENLVDSGVQQSDLSDRLGLMTAEILSRSRLSEIITDMSLYEDEQDDMQRIEIVDLMRSYVAVEPVLNELKEQRRNQDVNFNTFRIVFSHENPRIAKEVAQRIANDFINANITSRTEITAKSLDFMKDEIESLTGQLAVVERQIAAVKAENAGRLPEEMASNQRLLQISIGDLRDAQRVFDAAESDAAFWKNQALTAFSMSSPNDTTSPTHRLRSLEIERGSLLARGFT